MINYLSFKSVSFRNLFFFIFLFQPILPLKLLSLFFIKFKTKHGLPAFLNDRASYFYLIILLVSILHGFIYLSEPNYGFALSIILAYWLFSLIAFGQIKNFIILDKVTINNTLLIFFYINISLCFLQIIIFSFSLGFSNPFQDTDAAGDAIQGIFGNANANMIAMSFFSLYFYFEKKKIEMIIAILVLLSTTFMGGTLIFLSIVSMYTFFKPGISFKVKLLILTSIVLCGLFIFYLSPGNIFYTLGFIIRTINFDKLTPLKIASMIEIIKLWLSNFENFLIGLGPANLSSRTALLISGHYVSWFPEDYIYIHDEFRNINLKIWLGNDNPFLDVNSFSNQPNNVYSQIIGEYGFVGLLTFICFYLMRWWNIKSTFNRLLFFVFLGYLFTDYWFEFINVVVLFEMFMLYGEKINRENLKIDRIKKSIDAY